MWLLKQVTEIVLSVQSRKRTWKRSIRYVTGYSAQQLRKIALVFSLKMGHCRQIIIIRNRKMIDGELLMKIIRKTTKWILNHLKNGRMKMQIIYSILVLENINNSQTHLSSVTLWEMIQRQLHRSGILMSTLRSFHRMLLIVRWNKE